MKKPAKLLLRKETIRTLSLVQFPGVVAGGDPAFDGPPSDLKHCVAAAIAARG
jgi:hypothetical protein